MVGRSVVVVGSFLGARLSVGGVAVVVTKVLKHRSKRMRRWIVSEGRG